MPVTADMDESVATTLSLVLSTLRNGHGVQTHLDVASQSRLERVISPSPALLLLSDPQVHVGNDELIETIQNARVITELEVWRVFVGPYQS